MDDRARHRRPSPEHHLRGTYERLTSLDETLRRVQELSARTVILDIEPLVAYWDSGKASSTAALT